MKFFPDTIASRTIIVLLVGLSVFHIVSISAYQIGLDSEIGLTNEARLAERLITVRRALATLPADDREQTAHSLSGGPLEVHWSTVPLTVESGQAVNRTEGLRGRLLELAPELKGGGIIIGVPSPLGDKPSEPHLLLVSMKIADGSWTNFSIARLIGAHASLASIILSTTLMAISVLVLSIIVMRSVTRPLRQCAAAAHRLYVNGEPEAIAVTGPSEIRNLAGALNQMQHRVKRLVDDRTLTLAAISHDLKTPLTRIQLRAEEIKSDELRREIAGDLAEMHQMIDATLAFLKGDQSGEPVRDVDLNTILESICDDMADFGRPINYAPEQRFILRGRHLALKRAFNNLIINAAMYGSQVRISAVEQGSSIDVMIDDDGPGIPVDQREAVFQPFYRLESSRNRTTGGTGLGLTVARSIIRSHGGDITLHDAPSGGLRAIIRLPLPQKDAWKKQKVIVRKSP